MHDADWFTAQLEEHGHIIIKNTGVEEPKDFKKWGELFWSKTYNYDGGQTDRENIGDGVQNVNTFQPAVMDMIPHNEMAYQNFFPVRLAFCCFKQAELGGITTLVDNRKVSKYMPDKLKEKLLKHGQFVYNTYQNKDAVDSGEEEKWYNKWQDSYKVNDKQSLIAFLEREKINYEFYRNDWVRTWIHTPAIHYHEGQLYFMHTIDSGHNTYFQFLDQFNVYPPHERPFSSIWGNQEDVTDEEFYEFTQLNAKYQISVTYEKGDIFLVDNIKFKHGRTPFLGTRRIGALMGDKVHRKTEP